MDFKHLNSLLAVQKNFNTDEVCRKHLEKVLWDGEPKHLHRYCNEFGFRYNTRKQSEGERFNNALLQAGKRLRYHDLIEKDVVS